jgi:colanic acid/amylovoran biosynthesis glycosyltransferase
VGAERRRLGDCSGAIMNIAFLVDEFPSISQTFVLNQITGLLERGHQVDVYAREIVAGERHHADVARYHLLERTHSIACPASRWTRLARGAELCARRMRINARAVLGSLNVFRYGRGAASLSLLFQTAPFFRRHDILHCQFGHNGQLGAVIKKLGLQRKLVVTFHGYDIRAGIPSGGALYRELWEQADCLIAISDYNRDHLLRFGGDGKKIIDHPVGIDCRRFAYHRPRVSLGAPVRILSVARLVEEKGLEFGIRAVRWRLDERPETLLRYEIIGAGPLLERLRRLIGELGLGEYVHLLGARSQDEVIQALTRSDILLAPSLAEALPVSLMEAHAVGLPVLATRVGSVQQIVLDGISGFLVPPGDSAAMALYLGQLIDHPAERAEMGRRGRAHVENHYDIDRLNDRLVAIYENLLAA